MELPPSAADPWPGPPPPILGLDIGDCLSNTEHQCADSEQWRTAETGAYAFMVIFTFIYGPTSVHIFRNDCTRFSEQFGFREMGVPDSHFHRTRTKTGIGGKGPKAKVLRLTHMVDNDQECLWSVMCDPCGNAQKTLHKVILFTGLREMNQNVWPGHLKDNLMKCKSWLEIAKFFELNRFFKSGSDFNIMWQRLSARGPPHMEPLGPTYLRTLFLQIRDQHFDDAVRLLEQVPPAVFATAAAASAEAAPAIDTEEQEQHQYLRQKARDARQHDHWHWRASGSESESESSSGSSPDTPPSGNDDAPNKEADARRQSAAAADQGVWWCSTGGSAGWAASASSASWASDYHYGKAHPAASAGASWTEMNGWEQNNCRHWRSTAEQHRSVDGTWTKKKLLRAQRFRDGSLPVRGANSLVALCRQCKRNQPSPYCIVRGELCSVCCEQHRRATGLRCPQHQP
jgi:hypothetical protein